MLGFNVPAGGDLGVQRGVVGGIDPGDAHEPFARGVARQIGLFDPAELLVPDHAAAEHPHLVRRVPLVLVLLVTEHAAGRLVIGIGLDGVQGQAIGQRRLMTADAALGQNEERRGLILPQFQQAAAATRPDRPTRLPAGASAADFQRQHGQHDLVGIGRCRQVRGFPWLRREDSSAGTRQPGGQGRPHSEPSSSLASRARSSARGATSRRSHRAAEHGGRQSKAAQP